MKNYIEKQLKQGGQEIKAQAENRLAAHDLNQNILNAIESNSNRTTTHNNGYLGLAAAVCLSVLLGYLLQNGKQATQQHNPASLIASSAIKLKIKQIPLTIEEKINQPLLDEQQAIINDLIALKQQMLSI